MQAVWKNFRQYSGDIVLEGYDIDSVKSFIPSFVMVGKGCQAFEDEMGFTMQQIRELKKCMERELTAHSRDEQSPGVSSRYNRSKAKTVDSESSKNEGEAAPVS